MASQYTPTLGNIVSSTGEKEEDYLVGEIPITNRIDPRAAAEEESEDEEELFYMNDLVDEISTMLSPPSPPPFSTPTTSAFSPVPGPPKLIRSSCIGRTYPAVVTPVISDDEQEDENNLFSRTYSPPTPPRQPIARELVFTSEDENEELMTFPHVTFDLTNNHEDTDGSAYDEWDDDISVPETTTETPQLLSMQLVFYDENNNEIEHIDMDVHPQEEESEDDGTWFSNSDEDTDYDTEEESETEEETEEEDGEETDNVDFTDTESETSWSDGDDESWQYDIQLDRYEERNDNGSLYWDH